MARPDCEGAQPGAVYAPGGRHRHGVDSRRTGGRELGLYRGAPDQRYVLRARHYRAVDLPAQSRAARATGRPGCGANHRDRWRRRGRRARHLSGPLHVVSRSGSARDRNVPVARRRLDAARARAAACRCRRHHCRRTTWPRCWPSSRVRILPRYRNPRPSGKSTAAGRWWLREERPARAPAATSHGAAWSVHRTPRGCLCRRCATTPTTACRRAS